MSMNNIYEIDLVKDEINHALNSWIDFIKNEKRASPIRLMHIIEILMLLSRSELNILVVLYLSKIWKPWLPQILELSWQKKDATVMAQKQLLA